MKPIRRRTLLIGSAAVGLAGAAAIIGVRAIRRPREPGLVGHWSFDEGTGDAIGDASGYANDGSIVPAGLPASKWGTGEFAGSVSLSGGHDNHIRIPPSEILNTLRRRLTVAAHIYPRALWTPGSTREAFVAIVQRQWRTVLHPDLFYLGYGLQNDVLKYKGHLGLLDAEPSLHSLPKGADRPVGGAWVHLAGTYDGDTGAMALYVDGEQIAGQMIKGEIRLDAESLGRPLIIGAELNTPALDDASGEFDGYIDDVRLYDYALPPAAIAALAADAKARRATTNSG